MHNVSLMQLQQCMRNVVQDTHAHSGLERGSALAESLPACRRGTLTDDCKGLHTDRAEARKVADLGERGKTLYLLMEGRRGYWSRIRGKHL